MEAVEEGTEGRREFSACAQVDEEHAEIACRWVSMRARREEVRGRSCHMGSRVRAQVTRAVAHAHSHAGRASEAVPLSKGARASGWSREGRGGVARCTDRRSMRLCKRCASVCGSSRMHT